jgi:hypothetical protein
MVTAYLRILLGTSAGLAFGLALTVVVVFTKPPFLVDTPRSQHPLLLVALFALPAIVGGLIGLLWPRFFAERR